MKRPPTGETLLLADDEVIVLRFASRILVSHGYRVLTARHGESALTLSESFAGIIHMLITDIMMPVMNGKELAERLCALRPDIKVLYMSGYPRKDLFPPDTCKIEQVELLGKPFTGAQLLRKVRNLLDFSVQDR